MNYEWDESKRQSNLAVHELDFSQIAELDWETAIELEDTRRDYGETRFMVFGLLGDRLTVVIYTVRRAAIRIISWRKANDRERRFYDSQIRN